jgi:hypothetical protein
LASATFQGQLWGTHARDWAAFGEQLCLPLLGAALDAAHVTAGTRLLDAGCGAGLLALLERSQVMTELFSAVAPLMPPPPPDNPPAHPGALSQPGA